MSMKEYAKDLVVKGPFMRETAIGVIGHEFLEASLVGLTTYGLTKSYIFAGTMALTDATARAYQLLNKLSGLDEVVEDLKASCGSLDKSLASLKDTNNNLEEMGSRAREASDKLEKANSRLASAIDDLSRYNRNLVQHTETEEEEIIN